MTEPTDAVTPAAPVLKLPSNWKQWAIDAAERVGATFAAGFAATIGVTSYAQGSPKWWEACAGGGIAAVITLAKSLVAKWAVTPNSASLAPSVHPPLGG